MPILSLEPSSLRFWSTRPCLSTTHLPRNSQLCSSTGPVKTWQRELLMPHLCASWRTARCSSIDSLRREGRHLRRLALFFSRQLMRLALRQTNLPSKEVSLCRVRLWSSSNRLLIQASVVSTWSSAKISRSISPSWNSWRSTPTTRRTWFTVFQSWSQAWLSLSRSRSASSISAISMCLPETEPKLR